MMTATGVALLAWLAAAGETTPSAGSPAADRPGRELFDRAEANFNRGKFEDARADYQAAYDVEPLPAFLFNIAQCYRNMGDYARAQFFFQRFTALDPHSPNRPAAERLIAEMGQLEDERRARPSAAAAPTGTAPATGPATQAPSHDGGGAVTLAQPREPSPRPPVYRRAWFWAGVAGAVLLGGATAIALSRGGPNGTLPSIDAR